ncbi:MAG: serine/threonine protein kinase [Armatimonadetes bacterium]|nr:serine/threonine protein kinase [Armatimonadota bacterium]
MIGTTVGNYRIVEEIGRGGMGVVYKAVHQKIENQFVAVKLLSPSLIFGDPAAAGRAADEARSQARLRGHPNIVALYDYVEKDKGLFLVMEYVEGIGGVRDLAGLIRQRGSLPLAELKRLFGQVLSAVGFAHSHGIIHRDLKPLNIMLTEFGPKVGDFGIARIVSGDTSVSVSGHRVGSPAYMSPEQVLDKKLTRASDIYSLGCVLYEMAVGRLPFKESDTSSLFEAHLQESPVPPRQVNPQISERLEQVILKAMQKKPQDRFQTCKEFAAALGSIELHLRQETVPPLIVAPKQDTDPAVRLVRRAVPLAEAREPVPVDPCMTRPEIPPQASDGQPQIARSITFPPHGGKPAPAGECGAGVDAPASVSIDHGRTRRLPIQIFLAVLVLLAGVLVVNFVLRQSARHLGPRLSYLRVVVRPDSLGGEARLTLDGRVISAVGEAIACYPTRHLLRVEVDGRLPYVSSFATTTETTEVVATLLPEALVGIRYNNSRPDEQVVFTVRAGGREIVGQVLTTADLVADTLRTFPLRHGTYRFMISSVGRVLFDWTATLNVGDIAKIVPDNKGREFEVVADALRQ